MRRSCLDSRWRFAFGSAVAAGFVITMSVFDPFNSAPRPTILELAVQVPTALVLAGLIGGLASLTLFKLRDAVVGAPLVQDGSLCVYCAYVVYGLPEPRCPECGQPIIDADIDPSPKPALPAWSRLGRRTAGTLLVGYVMFLLYPHALAFGLVRRAIDTDLALSYLRLRPESSARALGGYLGHHDAQTRASAAFAMGCLYSRTCSELDALRRLALSDPVPMVRQMATQALGMIEPEFLQPIMPDLLRDSVPDCRWMALASGASYELAVAVPNHWVIPYLIDALDDPDATNRGYIYNRLVALSGKRFPYLPNSPRNTRLSLQAKWRDWWNTQGESIGAARKP